MSLDNLESTLNELEKYRNLERKVSEKLSAAEMTKTKELAAQHLLNFELARLNAEILVHQKSVANLEREQERLTKSSVELMFFLKRVRNSTILSNIRFDRKDNWIIKLKRGLETMDFSVEQLHDNPDKSISTFTQFSRRSDIEQI